MASDGIWVPDPDAEDKYPPPKKGMNRMTLKLIRKRAEHNEGIISTLEELTLIPVNLDTHGDESRHIGHFKKTFPFTFK